MEIYRGKLGIINSKVTIPTKRGDYIYFIHLGDRTYKIGTTNDIIRRMKEHLKFYKINELSVLWVSPSVSKYTTFRVEDKMKQWWIEENCWEYLANDRFIIPAEVKDVIITIRKDYKISL